MYTDTIQERHFSGLSIAALGRAIAQFMDNLSLCLEASQIAGENPFDEKALRRVMLEG